MSIHGCESRNFSNFVLYNRRKDASCGCGNISIFNECCHGGGFWSGIGCGFGGGLGFGLATWGIGLLFGGIGRLFGGLFGGASQGLGGMFSNFSFPGMGGWCSLGNSIGDVFNNWFDDKDDKEEVKQESEVETVTVKETVVDTDNEKIKQFLIDINKFDPKASGADEEYNRIKAAIEAAKVESEKEESNRDHDKVSYNELLKTLERSKTAALVAEGTPENKITINGTPKLIDDITLDDIKDLTPEEIKSLTPEKAKNVLTNLGYIEDGIGKMSAEYEVLLLLEKSGVDVQCAKNPGSEDQFVRGQISNVQKDATTGNVSFVIDNGTTEGMFQYKYSFQQVEDKDGNKCFHIVKIDKNGSSTTGYVEKNWKEKDYIFQGETEPLLTSGEPLITTTQKDDRIELKDVLQ